MKFPFQRIAISFAVLQLFACDFSKKNEPDSKNKETELKTKALKLAKAYLNSQYDYLTNKSNKTTWDKYNLDESYAIKNLIDNYKNQLDEFSFAYTDYTSELEIDSFNYNRKENQIYLKVLEEFSLTTNDPDQEKPGSFITTFGFNEFTFLLKKSNSKLLVDEFIPSDKYRFKINLDDIGLSNPSSENSEIEEFTYSYNRNNAIQYAFQHWRNGNSVFCDFTSGGGDCTNFISQCLLNGGWATTDNWTSKTRNQCTNPPCSNSSCEAKECYSCSWTVAQDFKYYITHAGQNRKEPGSFRVADVQIGDIVQFAETSNSNVGHSSIVTKKTNNSGRTIVYLTYRNADCEGCLPARDKPSFQVASGLPYRYAWKLKNNSN